MLLDLSLQTWVVNSIGILVIFLIAWWFWLSKPKARLAAANFAVEIIVDDGVYSPARIEVPLGKPTTLRFIRKDPNPCAEMVIFDDFGLSVDLPVDKPIDVTVTPDKPGEYAFTCQMQMYRGSLAVKV